MRPRFLLASAVAVASFAPVTGPLADWMAGGSSAALAQAQLQAPAELPPASYRSMQYVDSRGCAFVRAGSAQQTVWVPRVTRDRQQICGQPPTTLTGGQVVAPTIPPAPRAAAPSSAPGAAPVPAPVPAAAQVPDRPNVGAPIATVAGRAQPAPAVRESAPPRAITLAEACQGRTGPLAGYVNAQTGQPVSCGPAPAPVAQPVAQPVSHPASQPASRPVPSGAITLAEACQGRTGPLVGYVNAQTGQPVSCGPAPAPIAMAPVSQPVSRSVPPGAITLAEACQGRTGPLVGYVNAQTGQPVSCGPAPAASAAATAPASRPVPSGAITLAEACQGRTGPLVGYVNAQTGQPVSCGPAPAPAAQAFARAPQGASGLPAGAMTLAEACIGKSGPLEGYVSASTGLPVECPPLGAQAAGTAFAAAPVASTAAAADSARTRHVATTGGSVSGLLIDPAGPVPASNPQGVSPLASPPAGYRPAFDDGRYNTRRGPQGGVVVGDVVHAQHPAAMVSRNPMPVGAGHRFIQVGSFGQSANADRAAATLRALGLPVSVTANARGLQNVAAGPFADSAAAQAALQAVRNAGFGDAYTR